jgi:hypothetical protein
MKKKKKKKRIAHLSINDAPRRSPSRRRYISKVRRVLCGVVRAAGVERSAKPRTRILKKNEKFDCKFS